MKNLYSFCIITIINLAYSLRTPSINRVNKLPILDIGGKAELTCTVSNALDFPVLWIKINEQISESVIISVKNSIIIKDSRFATDEFNHDNISTTFVLKINEIQETDFGLYRCEISLDTKQKLFADVKLEVRRPPTISDNSSRSLIVYEGESIKMECYANGFPPPKISWRRTNNLILSGNRSLYNGNELKISNITKDDRGTYYCCAYNGFYRSARRHIALEVEFAPVIVSLEQSLQNDASINVLCYVEAYPPPAIVWFRKDENLINNQHYSISQSATTDEVTISTLNIITVDKRQYGNYNCKASNILGITEATIQVFESTTKSSSTRCLYVNLSCLIVVTYSLCVSFYF